MKRWLEILSVILLFSSMARASERENVANPAAWQATVSNESAAMYAGVSDSSKVITVLKQGDSVTINLEISGVDGKWYAVSAAGDAGASGYMSGRSLDVQQRIVANWEYQPPPEPKVAPDEESVAVKRDKGAIAAALRVRMTGDIKSFFVSKFGRTLPVSAFGQTNLHRRLGFDHHNGVDVALSPDSPDGRALLTKLRGFGFPFIAFRRAVPGVATGPHIHVGNPSPRR
jgi:hypothetical protein